MIASEARSYAFRKLRFHAFIMLSLIVALILSVVVNTHTQDQEIVFSSTFKNISGKMTEVNNQRLRSEDALKLWNGGLSTRYQSRNGLNLDLAKKQIENIKLSNRIMNVTVSLSNPAMRQDIKDLQYTNIDYSNLSIGFSAYTDKDAWKFVYDISEVLPGVVTYVSYSMTAVSEINQDILNTSNLKGAQIRPLIDGKLEILWQNLEDFENNASNWNGRKNSGGSQ